MHETADRLDSEEVQSTPRRGPRRAVLAHIVTTALLALVQPAFGHEVKFDPHRSGTLKQVQSDRVVIASSGKNAVTVLVNDTTIVHRNGREAHLPELKIGDRVVVDVMPNDDGTLYAVSIKARQPRKRPAKK